MSYTAKSVIFDIADNYGNASFMGIRCIEFFLEGNRIPHSSDDDVYATSQYSATYAKEFAFDNSIKTGAWGSTTWLSGIGQPAEQRLIKVFDSPIEFDEIRINNGHSSGTQTELGAKNVVINISTDEITSTTYEEAISNSTEIFDGLFLKHITSNIADDQYLFAAGFPTFTPKSGNYDSETQTIVITSINSDTIYYTTDGTDPTTGSSVYSTPLSFTDPTVIKALAVKADLNNSVIVSQLYVDRSDETPTMTSNTAPSGEASAISVFSSSYAAWKALDTLVNAVGWVGASGSLPSVGSPMWWRYQYASAKTITHMRFATRVDSGGFKYPLKFTILGSNNGSDWDTLFTTAPYDNFIYLTFGEWTPLFELTDPGSYTHYEINITDHFGVGPFIAICEVEHFIVDISSGWSGKINGVDSADIAKVCGIAIADIKGV